MSSCGSPASAALPWLMSHRLVKTSIRVQHGNVLCIYSSAIGNCLISCPSSASMGSPVIPITETLRYGRAHGSLVPLCLVQQLHPTWRRHLHLGWLIHQSLQTGKLLLLPPALPESPFPKPSPQGTPEALPYPILRCMSSTCHSHAALCSAWLRGALGAPQEPCRLIARLVHP